MTIGDRFTIKGASAFAEQMRLGFSDGRGLAAADPSVDVDPAMDNRNARAMAALGDAAAASTARPSPTRLPRWSPTSAAAPCRARRRARRPARCCRTPRRRSPRNPGVNLDEEAARLLQYQQAYQAAARVIATANSMFDTILSVISR